MNELAMHPKVKEAKAHMMAGKYGLTMECLADALEYHGGRGERHQEAAVLHNIGMVCAQMNEMPTAVKCYGQALKIAQELQFHDLAKAIDHDLTTILASLKQRSAPKKKKGLGRFFKR